MSPAYLDPASLPLPFCPGCSHTLVLRRLDEALTRLHFDPLETVVVTDIGCVGLADRHLSTHTFHGLHGRSVTYATGIKLADPDLHVIVLMGDGGAGIGTHHLVHAARRNIGVCVVVFNNLNFGMTGGEHSATTPMGAVTATTPQGALEQPMDIAATVAVNGAGFVARTTALDRDLGDLLQRALAHEGFALLDVWELCTGYFVPHNCFDRRGLEAALEAAGFERGVVREKARPEYARACRDSAPPPGKPRPLAPRPLRVRTRAPLPRAIACTLAGTAGTAVGTAGAVLGRAGVLAGLWATVANDYPVTVQSGYSLASVQLRQEPDGRKGNDERLLVVLSAEGLARVQAEAERLPPDATLYLAAGLPQPRTRARVQRLDLGRAGRLARRKRAVPLLAVAALVAERRLVPFELLEEAVTLHGRFVEENLEAVAAGRSAGILAAEDV